MAHTYAAILTAIWADQEFTALTVGAQRLYLFLLSQPGLSQVGFLDINLKKWGNKAAALSADDVEKHLAELAAAEFVVADYDTDEVLVRTYVRNSGSWKQPLIVAAMVPAVVEIESQKIRRALLKELDRLPLDELRSTPAPKGGPSARAQVALRIRAVREELLKGLPTSDISECETDPKGFPKGSAKPPRDPLANPLGTGTVCSVPPVDLGNSSSFSSETPLRAAADPRSTLTPELDGDGGGGAKIAEAPRPDVDRLCERLLELVLENGNRRRPITKAWRDAARLLLDRDRVGPNNERISFEKAMRLLEWSQQNDFWKGNVLSMPTFRKQYDRIRSDAVREWNSNRQQMTKAQRREANNNALAAKYLNLEDGAGLFSDWAEGSIPGEVIKREVM